MSEADLQRLAQILQERGEGLAAINSGEAQLLKALGGAGEALPGTQGMGPAGGPIRSYDNDDDNDDDDDDDDDSYESDLDSYEEEDLDSYDQFETNTQDALEYMRQQNEKNRDRDWETRSSSS